jgi:alkyl hydroperoxide reductase subunit F
MLESMMFDVIIIGAGPAGMTAAVFTARKGLKTLILSKDIGGQVNWTTVVENYMGFKEISGIDLMKRFEEQMKGDHLIFKEDEVVCVDRRQDNIFQVTGERTGNHQGRYIIIATGKRPRMLNVPGETEYRGKGVSYCSTCDAPLYRDASTVVVGGGNSGLQATLDLLRVGAKTVYLVTEEKLNGDQVLIDKVKADERVRLYTLHKVLEIQGTQLVQGVRIQSLEGKETTLSVEGVFIEIGLVPNAVFLDQVEKNERQEINVDCQCRTSVQGMYAAGDVTDVPEKQIIVAAGEGAKAAIRVWEMFIS